MVFGGTDPNGVTSKCLRWLDQIAGEWKLTVILGTGHQDPGGVIELTAKMKHTTEVVCDTAVISRYMSSADFAITSAGRTVFELASLGVPMMVVAQNDRETHHVFACTSPGVIYCGRAEELKQETFSKALRQVIDSEMLRRKMSEVLLDSGMRDGTSNIVNLIETLLQQTYSLGSLPCELKTLAA